MNPLLAEFVGTLVLILSVLLSGGNALVIGATAAAVLLAIGKISGGNINPAVSFAFFLKGDLSATKFMTYALTQLAAAGAAYYAYTVMRA